MRKMRWLLTGMVVVALGLFLVEMSAPIGTCYAEGECDPTTPAGQAADGTTDVSPAVEQQISQADQAIMDALLDSLSPLGFTGSDLTGDALLDGDMGGILIISPTGPDPTDATMPGPDDVDWFVGVNPTQDDALKDRVAEFLALPPDMQVQMLLNGELPPDISNALWSDFADVSEAQIRGLEVLAGLIPGGDASEPNPPAPWITPIDVTQINTAGITADQPGGNPPAEAPYGPLTAEQQALQDNQEAIDRGLSELDPGSGFGGRALLEGSVSIEQASPTSAELQ